MINVTDLDVQDAEVPLRVARVDRESWEQAGSPARPERRTTLRTLVIAVASAWTRSAPSASSSSDQPRGGYSTASAPAFPAGRTASATSRHRWLAWPLSIALALATGAAVSQTVAVVRMPLPAAVQSQATAAAVRAFYAAATAVLVTGDAAALEWAVPADFVDHAPLPGSTPDRAGLGRTLAALHDVAPGARLIVADLTVVGDQALARVEVLGAVAGTFLGVPLPGPVAAWGRVDAFRVGGGRVRERWGDGTVPVGFEAWGRLPVGDHLPTLAGVVLERVTLQPGDRTAPPPLESRLIAVESGRLTVAHERASTGAAWVAPGGPGGGEVRAVAPGAAATLSGGDLLALVAPIRYDLRNDGAVPATVLVAAVFPPDAPRRATSRLPSAQTTAGTPWPPGVLAQSLTGAVVMEVPTGALVGGLGRATLAPGASLRGLAAPGPVLLAVEGGVLDFAGSAGAAWVRRGTDGSTEAVGAGTLVAGDGALLGRGDVVTLRNLGTESATVLVLAIAPAG